MEDTVGAGLDVFGVDKVGTRGTGAGVEGIGIVAHFWFGGGKGFVVMKLRRLLTKPRGRNSDIYRGS